ncbi:MAG: ATP-binding protein [Candidatus Aminicenantes bacterium]|nr:ATP-binding protein [Candidatus Aminicenantes bacterium]
MKKLVREVGPWVDKERFWNREEELENLIELLDEGANIMITAPRRIGKTSLIREAGNRISDRFCCLQLDLQKSNSHADVITELSVATRPHMKLWSKTKDVFKNIISTAAVSIDSLSNNDLTTKFRDALLSNWQNKGDRMIEAIATSEDPVIIFMDEFPLVINRLLKGAEYKITPERLKEADTFLSWIRSITIQYKGRIRIVLTGSIGLEPILQQAGLSHTVNTFTPFELDPWDVKTAAGCLQALANNYKILFREGAKERMLKLIGSPIPHHVQIFFNYIYIDCKKRKNMECRKEDADRIFKSRMLSVRGHAELSTYEERLKMVLSNELLPLALELLTEAAVTGRLTVKAAEILRLDSDLDAKRSKEALREIIGILEHDGYLIKKKDAHVFVSNLVRDWWKARFGFQYLPAAGRERR